MSKFNSKARRPVTGTSIITTTGTAVGHEGATGFTSDAKGELFRLAVVNFVGEKAFYEDASSRDTRYNTLIREVALADFSWLSKMLPWLRQSANMRSASLTGVAEAAHARIQNGQHEDVADLIDNVLQRADEPGEFLAYWQQQFDPESLHVRAMKLPKSVRNGVARAVIRLYTARNFLKWDSAKNGVRFADVIELVHPAPLDHEQSDLFKYVLDERHHQDGDPDTVPMIAARRRWYSFTEKDKIASLRNGSAFRDAGLTWENVLSEMTDKSTAWEAMTPDLPYMAGIRNLRNMDEAGISDKVAAMLAARIADPRKVERSRQLPFRFLSAYTAAPSDRWKQALTQALDHSLRSVPHLSGRTLVLVDTSGSMSGMGYSARSSVSPAMAGALLGVVLAKAQKGGADLYGFAGEGGWGRSSRVVFEHKMPRGSGTLQEVTRFVNRIGEVGHGTEMVEAVRQTYKGHDRVMIVSDMQMFDDSGSGRADNLPIPDRIPVYGFNLGGYAVTQINTGVRNRHEFSGLTDQVFQQIAALESGANGRWPWEE